MIANGSHIYTQTVGAMPATLIVDPDFIAKSRNIGKTPGAQAWLAR